MHVEPLRGGMQEVEGGRGGPEHRAEADPPSLYHDAAAPEGGLAPREDPGAPTTGERR